MRLYAAGDAAVAVVDGDRVGLALEGRGARCLVVDPEDPDILYAGTSDEGLLKSEDGGVAWEQLSGIEHPRITSVAVSPVDGTVYAGTEPSALFASRDGGSSWRELEGLRNLPSAPTWSFPPRPWTSHVRAIALSHEDPDLVVAGIELGGVVRSADGGRNWQDQRPGAYADCHALAAHPAAPNLLYESAGGGFARSQDFGDGWEAADEGMGLRYAWGLAVDAEDPDLVTPRRPPVPGEPTAEVTPTRRSTVGGPADAGRRFWKAWTPSRTRSAPSRGPPARCTSAWATARSSAAQIAEPNGKWWPAFCRGWRRLSRWPRSARLGRGP